MPRLGRLVRRVTSVLIVGSLGLAIACGSSSKGPAAANGPLDASGSTDAVTVGGSDQLESPDLATIDSGTPKPSPISITVDSSKRRQPISRYIYGINFFAFDQDFTPTLTRLGGNRWSAYNWENNASNAGSDWYFQNDDYLGGGDTPGEAVRPLVKQAHDHDASAIITVPLLPYVAADKKGDGDVSNTPNFLATRFKKNLVTKSGALSLTPDTGDDAVYQDEFVNFIETTFVKHYDDPLRHVFYSLDNEPALWASTHAKLHPAALTYAELLSRTIEAAAMIKALSPKAIVLGPVLYGYTAYINLQDAPDAGEHGDFLSYYLDRLESEEATRQQRLVDVLDLHWYPEARGGGVRIIGTETGAAVVAARLQAPRSLWDPSYVEESWITDCCVEGGIDLLGGLKKRIALHYPGTKLSFSEYYYGAGQHISGAIAQADVLGIFGREGVFAATLWPLDDKLAFIHAAFKLFLDFDGAGGRFGDTSVEALTNDDAKSSVYASVDAADPGRMVLVLLNKTNGVLDAALTIQHSLAFTQAALFRVSGSSPAIQTLAPLSLEQTNAFNLSLPPMSVTTVLLTP